MLFRSGGLSGLSFYNPNVDAPIARAPFADAQTLLPRLREVVSARIRGKEDVIELALLTMVAGGHLLIEDIPGVGKSTLARSLAQAIGGSFSRVQFTSDLLPGDLIGVNVWRASQERFEFRRGPLFANVVLADEVNRAPPRTQSALLEAMAERTVSLDGETHALPRPFIVLATQNPEEHHGTYPLPESQRDRFMLRVSMGYAAPDIEVGLLLDPRASDDTPVPAALDTPEQLSQLQAQAEAVHLHEDLARYAQNLVQATREETALRLGVSTRGALSWVAAARAKALLDGRDHVLPSDLQDLAVPALAHRVLPAQSSAGDHGRVADELVREDRKSVV